MDKLSLIKSLKGHNLTCGWDMVCCFHQEKINEMLSAEYSAKRLTKEIPVHEEVPAGFVPGNVIYDGSVILKTPVISFLTDNKCEIEMAIKSGLITESYMGNPGKSISFDDNTWFVTGILSLSAVSGAMEAVDNAVASGASDSQETTSHGAGTVITFDGSAQGSKMLVYLDFSTLEDGLALQKRPDTSPTEADPFLMERVRLAVNTWFQDEVNSLHYILGGISDVPVETDESINLYPKSCLFCTQKTTAGSSLNIYMQISDSLTGSGIYAGYTGSNSPQFPDEEQMSCPLPENVTATAAISKRLLLNLYIQKSCKKKGWTAEIDPTFSGQGLKFLLSNSAVTIKTEDIYHTSSGCNLCTSSTHNGISIDFKSVPIELIFENQTGRFHWTHSSDVSYEDSLTSWGSAASPVVHSESSEGNFTYTISCDKDITLSASQDSQVQMSFSVGLTDYTLSSKINKAKKTDHASILIIPIPITTDDKAHAREVISSIDTEVKKKLPSFSFDFGELNLFFAANLLFPGKHTFSIQQSEAFGFPGDLMIFGDISLPD